MIQKPPGSPHSTFYAYELLSISVEGQRVNVLHCAGHGVLLL